MGSAYSMSTESSEGQRSDPELLAESPRADGDHAPDPAWRDPVDQRRVMVELEELSDRLIVMSEHSSQFLQDIFQVPAAKIDVIPHGVPNLAFVDPNFYKDRFGVGGQSVLLTFGLLSPNKGVESVIEAMPRILAQNSNVTYIVAGATHPHIRRREGDKYRESLQFLAKDLGVENNVIFHNRFVSPEPPTPDRESLPATIAESIRVGPHLRRLDGAFGASNSSAPFRNCTEALDTARPSQSHEAAKVPHAVLTESPSEARPERTERRTHPCGRGNEAA